MNESDTKERTCGLCGRKFVGMEGAAFEEDSAGQVRIDLCHPWLHNPANGPTCYQRWTVYDERPDTPDAKPAIDYSEFALNRYASHGEAYIKHNKCVPRSFVKTLQEALEWADNHECER